MTTKGLGTRPRPSLTTKDMIRLMRRRWSGVFSGHHWGGAPRRPLLPLRLQHRPASVPHRPAGVVPAQHPRPRPRPPPSFEEMFDRLCRCSPRGPGPEDSDVSVTTSTWSRSRRSPLVLDPVGYNGTTGRTSLRRTGAGAGAGAGAGRVPRQRGDGVRWRGDVGVGVGAGGAGAPHPNGDQRTLHSTCAASTGSCLSSSTKAAAAFLILSSSSKASEPSEDSPFSSRKLEN